MAMMSQKGVPTPILLTMNAHPEILCACVFLHRNWVSLGIGGLVSGLSSCKAALTAVGRRVGVDVGTRTAIATPRAGARTTSQTTYGLLHGAFGWV